MDDVTNAQRAEWGLFALADFVPRTGVDAADDAIGDLITNLLHLARGYGLDTNRLLSNAAGMMATEVDEDDEGDMEVIKDRLSRMFDDEDFQSPRSSVDDFHTLVCGILALQDQFVDNDRAFADYTDSDREKFGLRIASANNLLDKMARRGGFREG